MTLSNSKVADHGEDSSQKALDEAKTLVKALVKAVACYRHLSSCVGGCTDSVQLRSELRQTRERAQQLALENRQLLTALLRNKTLPEDERLETELLWISFSSSLELLHADMCRVFSVGQNFPLTCQSTTLVQTGLQAHGEMTLARFLQAHGCLSHLADVENLTVSVLHTRWGSVTGETAKVTARALSMTELNQDQVPPSVEHLEQGDLEVEMACVDQMIEDMEQRVNVLRWTVEAQGPQYAETQADGSSLVLLNEFQGEPQRQTMEKDPLLTMLSGILVTAAIFVLVCMVYFH